MSPLYLDHNSTTPLLPEVVAAMREIDLAGFANPASQHQLGQKSRRKLEEYRERILYLLGGKTTGMDADRLIFTSGGTEANNLALRGLIGKRPSALVISAIEHHSIAAAAEHLAKDGHEVRRIPVLSNGAIDLSAAEELISKRQPAPAIVSVMLANNETGAVQPIAALREICDRVGVPLMTDAAQAVTKTDASFRELGLAAMTIAPHKFHGPLGIGALALKGGLKIDPLLFGGFQQEGIRPGTESLSLAAGLATALELGLKDTSRRAEMARLRDLLQQTLTSNLLETVVNAAAAPRLPNTLNIAFPPLDRQVLILALDRAGVCCSTGSACASGSSQPSPVLVAMGLPTAVLNSSLRLSLGATTTEAEVLEASQRIIKAVNDLRHLKTGRKTPAPPPHHV